MQGLGGLGSPVLVDKAQPNRCRQDDADDQGVTALTDEIRSDCRDGQQDQKRRPQLAP
jgi:hypothetical protein